MPVDNPAPKGEASPANAGEVGEVVEPKVPVETPKGDPVDSTAARLLSESEKWKRRALAAEGKVDESKTESLKTQNKFKELYESTLGKLNAAQEREVKDKLNFAVNAEAAKAGCIDPNDLFKLGDSKLIQYDPETGVVHGAEAFVTSVKDLKPYLFTKPSTPNITSVPPGGTPGEPKKLTALEIAKLPKEEKAKVWAKLMQ